MRKDDNAVSPVVGVMLMLVVTIIIAAVVSSFAGNLASANAEKTPTLAMDVRIVNSGFFQDSGFFATVTGASEAIPTKDLQIVTSWRNSTGTAGGATVNGGIVNVDFMRQFGGTAGRVGLGATVDANKYSVAPYGMGSGVINPANPTDRQASNPTNPYTREWQQFGNYALVPGVILSAIPAPFIGGQTIGGYVHALDTAVVAAGGYGVNTLFKYDTGANYFAGDIDPMEAVLGKGWETLKLGDKVSIIVIHAPSGKTIFSKTIAVEA